MEQILTLSLMITGLHVATWQGNVLAWPRIQAAGMLDKYLGKCASRYVQKPLWDCLPCMASVWTVLFTWNVDLLQILAVCGLNVLIEAFLNRTGYGAAD